jgi:hypothetical protein
VPRRTVQTPPRAMPAVTLSKEFARMCRSIFWTICVCRHNFFGFMYVGKEKTLCVYQKTSCFICIHV